MGTIGCAWLAAAAMIMAVIPASTSPRSKGPLHRFEFDGSRGITDEEHLGIVGGRLTAGVSLSDVAGLRGIWAPPYVSSDFILSLRISGRTTPADTYRWLPNEIVRHASAGWITIETRTTALAGLRAVLVRMAFTNKGRDHGLASASGLFAADRAARSENTRPQARCHRRQGRLRCADRSEDPPFQGRQSDRDLSLGRSSRVFADERERPSVYYNRPVHSRSPSFHWGGRLAWVVRGSSLWAE